MTRRYLLPVFSLGLVLFILAACVDINVTNLADSSVRVRIQTPDGGNYIRRLEAVDVITSFSDHGGSFHIATLPDEAYLTLLNNLREEISRRLFTERQSLSAADVQKLTTSLQELDNDIDRVARQGASCSVWAPDFSTIRAVVVWSADEDKWLMGCEVDAPEE